MGTWLTSATYPQECDLSTDALPLRSNSVGRRVGRVRARHTGTMTEPQPLERRFITAVERLGRALRVVRQDVATKYHLSVLQLLLIEHIAEHRPFRVGALAHELNVTQPTVSDALGSLESKEVIERVPDPVDARASLIKLTASGSRLAAKLATELEALYTTRPVSDENRSSALVVVLEEIGRLQELGVITVDRSCLTCDHYQPPTRALAARCLLLDRALPHQDLRVDCPDHSTS